MDKDTASPPHYYSVGAPLRVEPPPTVVLVPQPTNVEAQIGYDYQLQLMAKCARGEHQVSRKYGVVGIIFGVALFPVGMLVMLCDRKKKCDRCGLIIE
ncbi:hypothetical protein FOMPIDRAFT_1139162 [Fomitopsis schrenkii]|uniref:Uncharacterized protein n=1 Tax=Fomitopsis schrenkii TaxID=2126942 RepID=S8EIV8_FOMSC|nr:hypothetical protein FOMPIDRAFT_1139162 [Fomitopsis schrenkii]